MTTTTTSIDDEWKDFIANRYVDDSDSDLSSSDSDNDDDNDDHHEKETHSYSRSSSAFANILAPEPTDIYISTKSKIVVLNQPISLELFWDIPVIDYSLPQTGILKKQIILSSKTPAELDAVCQKFRMLPAATTPIEEQVITHICNPTGRIKFKDIRKITVGISKKDILKYRSAKKILSAKKISKKNAMQNCFVVILRIQFDDVFKEFHVKLFNTGEIEMPGVQNDQMFSMILEHVIALLQPFYSIPLAYTEKCDTILINSNFNCGFYINREVLYDILKMKYNIDAIYDPCSYPGIQCKFYFNNDIETQTGMQISTQNTPACPNITKVSFMIFRTGSVLIVGKCTEMVLRQIYTFLSTLLKTEFAAICQKLITPTDLLNKIKKKKIFKRSILFTKEDAT